MRSYVEVREDHFIEIGDVVTTQQKCIGPSSTVPDKSWLMIDGDQQITRDIVLGESCRALWPLFNLKDLTG